MSTRNGQSSPTSFLGKPCRLDVWLHRTRLFKTRSLAAKTILKGKIRVSRHGKTERITKPHLMLRPGDRVIFMRGPNLIQVEMIAAGTRRGPAPEAQGLYRNISVPE